MPKGIPQQRAPASAGGNPTEASNPISQTPSSQAQIETPAPQVVQVAIDDPIAGLTGEQVKDLARNQPEQFLSLVNPGYIPQRKRARAFTESVKRAMEEDRS